MKDNYVLFTSFDETVSVEPVTLAEQKDYLIIAQTETAFDTLITTLIKTARQQLEAYLNRSLVDKTVTARIENGAGYMHLPYSGDVITITSIEDADGNAITDYKIFDDLFSGVGGLTPTPANNFYHNCNTSFKIVYDVSYPDGIRAEFKVAIMQQTAWLYENRGDAQALSPIVKLTLKPYKRTT